MRHDKSSFGRPHSKREFSIGQDGASCIVKQRIKESAKCGTHRPGKRRKGASTTKRQKSGEAEGRPSHNGRAGLRDDPLQHFTRNTRSTQIRCNKSKQLSTSKKSLNTDFPMPFLRSLMLRIGERASSAGTINAPSSSPSGKRILSCSANTLHK